jgi:hypothetical protein
MSFGLTKAPTMFQSLMNYIFVAQMCKYVLVLVDLVYCHTLEEHITHLNFVFNILRQHKMVIKKSKFMQQDLEYVVHIIGAIGVSTDSIKTVVLQNWLVPTTLKACQ